MSKAPMIDEYFAIGIKGGAEGGGGDEGEGEADAGAAAAAALHSMPILLESCMPGWGGLPSFLLELATAVGRVFGVGWEGGARFRLRSCNVCRWDGEFRCLRVVRWWVAAWGRASGGIAGVVGGAGGLERGAVVLPWGGAGARAPLRWRLHDTGGGRHEGRCRRRAGGVGGGRGRRGGGAE
jgi:hypothetical protein